MKWTRSIKDVPPGITEAFEGSVELSNGKAEHWTSILVSFRPMTEDGVPYPAGVEGTVTCHCHDELLIVRLPPEMARFAVDLARDALETPTDREARLRRERGR